MRSGSPTSGCRICGPAARRRNSRCGPGSSRSSPAIWSRLAVGDGRLFQITRDHRRRGARDQRARRRSGVYDLPRALSRGGAGARPARSARRMSSCSISRLAQATTPPLSACRGLRRTLAGRARGLAHGRRRASSARRHREARDDRRDARRACRRGRPGASIVAAGVTVRLCPARSHLVERSRGAFARRRRWRSAAPTAPGRFSPSRSAELVGEQHLRLSRLLRGHRRRRGAGRAQRAGGRDRRAARRRGRAARARYRRRSARRATIASARRVAITAIRPLSQASVAATRKALRPYAPTHVRARRDGGGRDDLVHAARAPRRRRMGGGRDSARRSERSL